MLPGATMSAPTESWRTWSRGMLWASLTSDPTCVTDRSVRMAPFEFGEHLVELAEDAKLRALIAQGDQHRLLALVAGQVAVGVARPDVLQGRLPSMCWIPAGI